MAHTKAHLGGVEVSHKWKSLVNLLEEVPYITKMSM